MKRLKIEIVGSAEVDYALALDGIAEALAGEVRAAILRQPGTRWKKTDALRNNIVATDDAVTVAPSAQRLIVGDIAEKFSEQVMPVAPLSAAPVREATERAIAASVKGDEP